MKGISVIITAGGIGKRMGTELPKQFLLLENRPVLMHTITKIHSFDSSAELILCLPSDWISYWEEELKKYQFAIPHKIVEGGTERFNTVKNALPHCTNEYVAVHDAVRPLVSDRTLSLLWDGVTNGKCIIPVIEVRDSVRSVEKIPSKAIDRKFLRLVQTPQCFPKGTLSQAYEQEYDPFFTDDASVVEKAGHTISLCEGNQENIKITHPIDLLFASSLLKSNNNEI